MPKSLASICFESQEISRSVPSKGESGSCCEYACPRTSLAKFVRPSNLACLVIDRLQNPFAPETIICSRPAIGSIRWFVEVEAVGGMGAHDKQTCLRIKAGGPVVGQASLVRRY